MFTQIEAHTLTLHDGRKLVVRPIRPEDGDAATAFYRALPEEDRQYLREDVTRSDFTERYLHKVLDPAAFALLAWDGTAVVADASLFRDQHGWTRHVATLRVVVAHEWQHAGVASALISVLVQRATSIGVDKLVAEVVDHQMGARHAFEKLGFAVEATLKGHVKDIRGRRHDLLILTNDVSHLWERMAALTADYSPTME